jgi:methylmalonyl-CoA mutase N-terminal domain/subunit
MIMLAFYVVAAEEQGVPADRLAGTIQADILKEYIAQKEWCFPIDPDARAGRHDRGARGTCRAGIRSIRLPHPRGGSTAAQELAFTLKDGLTYVEEAERGLTSTPAAPVVLLQRRSTSSRRSPTAPRAASGPASPRDVRREEPALRLMRFHTQTAGVSLTAQQPLNNIVRTAIEALAGVLGGTQSLHTNSYDEALALPTEDAQRAAHAADHRPRDGVTNTIDPLGGSYFVEARPTSSSARPTTTSRRSTSWAGWRRGQAELPPARDRRRLL